MSALIHFTGPATLSVGPRKDSLSDPLLFRKGPFLFRKKDSNGIKVSVPVSGSEPLPVPPMSRWSRNRKLDLCRLLPLCLRLHIVSWVWAQRRLPVWTICLQLVFLGNFMGKINLRCRCRWRMEFKRWKKHSIKNRPGSQPHSFFADDDGAVRRDCWFVRSFIHSFFLVFS